MIDLGILSDDGLSMMTDLLASNHTLKWLWF